MFAALAGDRQHLVERCFAPAQPKRFGEPQASAIKKRQDGGVALALPLLFCNLDRAVERACCILDGQWLRHAMRQLGRAERGERRCFGKPATLQKTQKTSQYRQPAGEGAALDPGLRAPGPLSPVTPRVET